MEFCPGINPEPELPTNLGEDGPHLKVFKHNGMLCFKPAGNGRTFGFKARADELIPVGLVLRFLSPREPIPPQPRQTTPHERQLARDARIKAFETEGLELARQWLTKNTVTISRKAILGSAASPRRKITLDEV